jgi:cytochrome c oxidase cbb3-type subunit 2
MRAFIFLILLQGVAAADTADRADYDRYCVWCHGDGGNGRGPSAARLDPAPRDFTSGAYRCRTTPSGSLPTDDDLRLVITRGVPGTAMPGWSTLSRRQLESILATLKSFAPAWATKGPGAPITVPPEPPRTKASVAHGAEVYEKMQCGTCHGKTGRGDGPAAATLHDDWGNAIRPADFTRRGMMRCGDSPARIYTTFMTGLNGTPMPSFEGTIAPDDAWDLVHFVESLRE